MNWWSRSIVVLLVLFGFSVNLQVANAQSIWIEPRGDKEITLEVLKPAFNDSGFLAADFSTFTLAYYLSGRFKLSETVRLVTELPFARAAIEDRDISDTTVGDLYLGTEFGEIEGGFQGEFGFRLPMASEENLASIVGVFADFVDRAAAFLPNTLSITVACKYKYYHMNGLSLGARLASLIWVPTGDSSGDDSEMYAHYSLMAWYESEIVGVGGGLSGRYLVTEDDGDFGERSLHQLGLFSNFTLGRWMPGIQLRVPLDDDLKDFLAPELSLSIGVKLN